LARLKNTEKQKARKSTAISIKKEGDATVVIVGSPSVGKSTLLNALTKARSEVASYDFTTLKPTPGILEYKGAKIQLVDMPGIVEGASKRKKGKEIISAIRTADLILILTDIFNVHQIEIIKRELYDSGIRLDERPPDITIKKRDRGGINISSTVPLFLDEQTIVEILREYKILNADVLLREDITIERLIDAVLGNRVYLPSLTAINKIDLGEVESVDNSIQISAVKRINLDMLVEEMYEKLDFIRIYLKPPSKKASSEPLILKRGSRIEDVCRKLHRNMLENFRYARVWGRSVKFDGQRVGLEHVLEDEDTLTIYAK
jgi:hypothetical protein